MENMDDEFLKAELAQNKLNLDCQKNDFEHNKVTQKLDLFGMKQEMIRRGIETLNSVLRTEMTTRTGSQYLEADTRKNAEKKLNIFINALVVPT